MDPEFPDDHGIHALLHEEGRFLSFVRSRLGSADYSEDILQTAYLKSLDKGSQLRSEESIVAWFYSILRHAIADHFRANHHAAHSGTEVIEVMQAPADEDLLSSSEDCVRVAMRGMRAEDIQLIEWVDLEGVEVSEVASRLAVTSPIISKRLFRARQALRIRLQELCRTCSATKCLYCRCPATEGR